METIKIFLASSSELESDRREFEIFINRKNKEYIKHNLFLELLLWEDFIDAMSATRLQDEYNKAVAGCDIFVSLFHTKVGKYTEEEFLKALETFKANGKPLIYTYFNQGKVEITPQLVSLLNFQQKLSDMGHFYTKYNNIEELKYKFSEQLIKVLPQLTGIDPSSLKDLRDNENNTRIEQNFYGSVENAVGSIGRNQNINKSNTTRNINIDKGNYNENIHVNYYEQSGNFGIGHMSGGTIQGNAEVAGTINEAEHTINRYTLIDFPSESIIESEANLIIQLVLRVPKQTRTLQKISISTDSKRKIVNLYVQITAENFRMQHKRKQLILPVDGDSEEVIFQLTPIELGEQMIEIEFFHDGSRVGYAIIKTHVKGLDI
ncbi:MAG: hypothetical protein AAGE84_25410 [Cyanobacteria bacterium P01_G01_bin.39]